MECLKEKQVISQTLDFFYKLIVRVLGTAIIMDVVAKMVYVSATPPMLNQIVQGVNFYAILFM